MPTDLSHLILSNPGVDQRETTHVKLNNGEEKSLGHPVDHQNASRGGVIENTENSVTQGNAEVVMKGQYSDAFSGDALEDHSQHLLPRQQPVPTNSDKSCK